MSVYRSAALYYGFAKDFSIIEEETEENISEINQNIGLTAKKINISGNNPKIVIGKKIKQTQEGCFEKITASEVLQSITGIEKTYELNKILEELNMDDQSPRLILCSEVS